MQRLTDFHAVAIDGSMQSFAQYEGHVVLVVNTASACGLTPQLDGLQDLHQRYAPQGLVVIGFPCNQFGEQDKGSNKEIAAFCQQNYGVEFVMMEKVEVNGPHTHPLFRWLKEQAPGFLGTRSIKWNFTKFLIGRDGQVIQRFGPWTKPAKIVAPIGQALKA